MNKIKCSGKIKIIALAVAFVLLLTGTGVLVKVYRNKDVPADTKSKTGSSVASSHNLSTDVDTDILTKNLSVLTENTYSGIYAAISNGIIDDTRLDPDTLATTVKHQIIKGNGTWDSFSYTTPDGIEIKSGRDIIFYGENSPRYSKEESLVGTSAADMSVGDDDSSYSGTNVQVQGVDEGDIVKTDGKYAYSLADDKVIIFALNDGKTSKAGVIDLSECAKNCCSDKDSVFWFEEMFLQNNHLAVVMCVSDAPLQKQQDEEYIFRCFDTQTTAECEIYFDKNHNYCGSYFYHSNSLRTYVAVYDVSNPKQPLLSDCRGQDGTYVSSRFCNNTMYVVTDYSLGTIYKTSLKENSPATYTPKYYSDGKTYAVADENITMIDGDESNNYVVVTASNIDESAGFSKTAAILGFAQDIYSGGESIYLYFTTYDDSIENIYKPQTGIIRYTLADGDLKYSAWALVDGTTEDQFSMSESEGYLRVVTTTEVSRNDQTEHSASLYVLDDNMEITGKLDNIADNETVRSVNFIGDIGFIVTFRTVDPLFTVDLSNPEKPEILSKLKIPGFSEYLYPYGEGRLLGFGQSADESEGTVTGLKLSMFDISNPSLVTELASKTMDDTTYSPALYNHKAMLMNVNKNLIGFASYPEVGDKNYFDFYTYTNGFEKLASISLVPFDSLSTAAYRTFYSGDYLYIVFENHIRSYDMSEFENMSDAKVDYKITDSRYASHRFYTGYIVE